MSPVTPEFHLFVGPDGCGQVRLPSNAGPAHLRAVRAAIGPDHEIAPIEDDTWRPAGAYSFLTIRKRVAKPATARLYAAASIVSTGLIATAIVKAVGAGHWTQAILQALDDIQEYV